MNSKLLCTKLFRNNESFLHFEKITRILQAFFSTTTVQQIFGARNQITRQATKLNIVQGRGNERSFRSSPILGSWGESKRADGDRKVIPKVIYVQNPWKYFVTKCKLWKLRYLWDPEFVEKDFIRGSKQAAIVISDIIRTQDVGKVGMYTTSLGNEQIKRDMITSRDDFRLKFIKFDTEHLRRAIPLTVATRTTYARKYCFIDMLFVALRNTKDFNTIEEIVEMRNLIHRLDTEIRESPKTNETPHRIVFAEIFMRFRRDYSDYKQIPPLPAENPNTDWAVSFYKILTFDILTYYPL